jgi:hypothetical protein
MCWNWRTFTPFGLLALNASGELGYLAIGGVAAVLPIWRAGCHA